jgi:hypothetical protein
MDRKMETHMKRAVFCAVFSSAVFGCAADQGTRPQDMSQVGHEQAAKQEDQRAAEHQAQSVPTATETSTRCVGRGGCWTSVTNPTKEHEAAAQRHRELAAKHRAASATLAQAEAQHCSGIPEDDRDMSPFAHREDIVAVKPLEETHVIGQGKSAPSTKRHGATIVFRAVPGLTAEWLQRVVNCHVARGAAVGHQMPEMEYCPLMLKGVTTAVSSAGDGFAVNVRSDDPATAAEILKRAEALRNAGTR